jgi:hypothetical protein
MASAFTTPPLGVPHRLLSSWSMHTQMKKEETLHLLRLGNCSMRTDSNKNNL